MAIPDDPAERHRRIAADFGDVVAAVPDWDAPSPVDTWTAEEIVDHLITWSKGFLGTAADLPVAPSGAGVAGRWQVHVDGIQQVLDDPSSASLRLANPHVGEISLAEAIDRFYTTDVFMHTWDLARAAGIAVELDEDECARLLAGMIEMEDVLRASEQFGQAVPVPDDASVADRLIGFIGRDPDWKP